MATGRGQRTTRSGTTRHIDDKQSATRGSGGNSRSKRDRSGSTRARGGNHGSTRARGGNHDSTSAKGGNRGQGRTCKEFIGGVGHSGPTFYKNDFAKASCHRGTDWL